MKPINIDKLLTLIVDYKIAQKEWDEFSMKPYDKANLTTEKRLGDAYKTTRAKLDHYINAL